MVLLALSASHHDLDLDVLEQLSSGARSVGPAAVADGSVAGCVVLATCNRFELYLETADGADPQVAAKAATQAVAAAADLPVADVAHALRPRTGAFVVAQHLFGVASGLDSVVVGEREVAGRVRRALGAARRDGTTSSGLERLFQRASRASRAVGAATSLGSSGRSVVTVALDLVEERLPRPEDRRTLLIGTGSYARAVVAALRARGSGPVSVLSPSGRAAEFAAARGLTPVPPDGLVDALAEAHLVVGCSGARGPVLRPDDVVAALPGHRPLVVLDLALRHDVDPAVADVPGVTLVDLATVQQHAGFVAPEVADGWQVVAEQAARFADAMAEEDVVPAVVALRGYVQGMVEDELRRRPRTAGEERALRRFAARLLHLSVLRARENARRGEAQAYRDAVETLLGVELPAAGPQEPRYRSTSSRARPV